MKTAPFHSALALALGLGIAVPAAAQDAPTPQQKQELDAARSALDQAAKRYAELAARYGGDAGRTFRVERSALRKPVIGVVLAADEQAGVRIAGVTPDSAAASAGLKSGDRLVGIDGRKLDAASAAARVEQARGLLAALDAKTAVALAYERAGKAGTVSVTPKVGERVLVVPGGMAFDGNVKVFVGDGGELREIEADRMRGDLVAARARAAEAKARAAAGDARHGGDLAFTIAPDVRSEILRLGTDCKGQDCRLPALAEALRWSGLNLAAVDAQLGRYFGTDRGVLVLSTGRELDALQAGDVILKIAGESVASPREAMELLRAQPADGKVAVDYLRDRKPGAAQVDVPRPATFQLRAPGMGEGASVRRVMVIDKDGKTQTREGGKDDAAPAWVRVLPATGERMEKRVQVILDRKAGAATGSDAPSRQEP